MPIFYGSAVEGLAYLKVSDEDWAEYAAAIAKAAAERGEPETAP